MAVLRKATIDGVAIALLGPPQITRNGAPVSFDTRKAVALLAYPAVTGRAHSREALAVLLWPEYADARNALRRTLSTLHGALGDGWIDAGRDQVAIEGADARRRFFEAMADVLLQACDGRALGVLFVDDAQWADGASLDVLAFLARRLRGKPGLLLLAWRDDDVPADHLLRAILAEARRDRAAPVPKLAQLDVNAVAALVQTAASAGSQELSERLHRESDGVPLFVVEYLAALREGTLPMNNGPWPLPGRARDLLEARLRPLSEPARQFLTAAAAVGRDVDLATLCAAAAVSEEQAVEGLEELLGRGLLAEVSAAPLRFAFGHEHLRSVAYERSSQLRRRVLHRRIAAHLNTLLETAPRPGLFARVAQHYAEAGETRPAAAGRAIDALSR